MTDDADQLMQWSNGLADAVGHASAWTVTVAARGRIAATGIMASADGLVVTADHVIERDEDIEISLGDDGPRPARLVGRDPSTDIAVVQVEGGDLPVVDWAPEDSVRVGHFVLALGRPGAGVQASFGVVSVIGGPWRRRRGEAIEGFVRTDTTFFPGFSGGPLVDTGGRAIGINSSHFRPGQGITVPAATVQRVIETLRKDGRIRRAYLGIGSQSTALPAALRETADGQETALLIVSVDDESAAGRAGIMVGDLLIGIDGESIADAEALQSELDSERVGATVSIRLLRGGEPLELSATLGERE
ncbi:MAG: trypsin-like peptidase domain-containing protein [Planctomycetes bacterium]|nr:trypsin-like peptidase domain-containing protein [Planctomycetota bacterium]